MFPDFDERENLRRLQELVGFIERNGLNVDKTPDLIFKSILIILF